MSGFLKKFDASSDSESHESMPEVCPGKHDVPVAQERVEIAAEPVCNSERETTSHVPWKRSVDANVSGFGKRADSLAAILDQLTPARDVKEPEKEVATQDGGEDQVDVGVEISLSAVRRCNDANMSDPDLEPMLPSCRDFSDDDVDSDSGVRYPSAGGGVERLPGERPRWSPDVAPATFNVQESADCAGRISQASSQMRGDAVLVADPVVQCHGPRFCGLTDDKLDEVKKKWTLHTLDGVSTSNAENNRIALSFLEELRCRRHPPDPAAILEPSDAKPVFRRPPRVSRGRSKRELEVEERDRPPSRRPRVTCSAQDEEDEA